MGSSEAFHLRYSVEMFRQDISSDFELLLLSSWAVLKTPHADASWRVFVVLWEVSLFFQKESS